MSDTGNRMNDLAAAYLAFSTKTATDTASACDNAHGARRANDEYARLAVAGTVASVPNHVAASSGSTVQQLTSHDRKSSTVFWWG